MDSTWPHKRLVIINGYAAYFLIGFFVVLFAPALPAMIKDFGLSLAQAGLIFPARSLGQLAAVMIGGAWSDRVGRKPTIVTGAALFALGSLGVAVGSSWPLVLAGFLVSSVGQGFANSSINGLIADAHPTSRGAALNRLHGIYGLGAFIGPLVAGGLLLTNQGWRPAFLISSLLWLMCLLVTLFLHIPAPGPRKVHPASGEKQPLSQGKSIYGAILFAGLFMVAFLYNGTANGLIGWINSYLLEKADVMPSILAANMVSLFYLALTIGRFLWSGVVQDWGYARVILICAAGPVAAFPLVIWGGNSLLVALGVMASGLFFSGLYPTALAYAADRRPELAGTITGTLSMAMTLGSMSVPWLTGIIAGRTGFQSGMIFIYIFVVCLLGVAVGISKAGTALARTSVVTAATHRGA
ncbi:MAG TPA: MFS transporter [Firmicutes bacterium]|nr:MFS transporter [Bacillota bacterium]